MAGLPPCKEPLLPTTRPAKPSLLGSDALSDTQQRLDQRIRTLCLVILSLAVLFAGAYYLRTILIRFVLAVALRYLLMPIIDCLSCRDSTSTSSRCRLPRGLAIMVALALAGGLIFVLGLIVTRSVASFASHSEVYRQRIETLLEGLMNLASRLQDALGSNAMGEAGGHENASEVHKLADMAKQHLNLKSLLLSVGLGTAHVLENTIYILLILAFLLAGSRSPPTVANEAEAVHLKAEAQIYRYVRGKVSIGLLVAVLDAAVLCALHVKMCLVFAVCTFWLTFVPNVGLAIFVLLPMPLVLLEPGFSVVSIALAFLGPLAVGLVAKDVLEPMVIGRACAGPPAHTASSCCPLAHPHLH